MQNKQKQYQAQQQHSQADPNQPGNTVKHEQLSPSSPSQQQTHQEKGFQGSVYLSRLVEEKTQSLIHLLGYGLLVFALIDYLHILIPLRLTNPVWEFQTIGALVEHSAIPLLGLMFVFFRHEGYVPKLEKKLLGLLSWVCLLVGLFYLLMLPLGINDTWRIYHSTRTQITDQLTQQTQQFQQLEGQLQQAKTNEQLQQVLASVATSGRSPDIENLQTSKAQLLTQLSQAERKLKIQADNTLNAEKNKLIKSSVKWHLGALVSSALFIVFWHLSSWTRKANYW